MALPNSVNAATPAGADNPSLGDDQFRDLKTFLEDIFSIPDNTSISAAGLDFVAAGLQTVIFQDAAANPTTAGYLQRNAANLVWHDGTAAGRLFYVGGTDVPVADGGTGLSSGTSGGVLGYTAAGTLASSVALTASAIVLGGGAGATPTPMGSLGTTTTLLHGNAAGAPTFAAVSLTADVTGTLPVVNGGSGVTTSTGTTNLVLSGSPTIVTPTIASFANAAHDHDDAAGGGQLNATNVFSAGTVPTARLGSGSASSSTFLRGDQTWASAGPESGTWSNVTASRSAATIYQNTGGKKRRLAIVILGASAGKLDAFVQVGSASPPDLTVHYALLSVDAAAATFHEQSMFTEVPSNWYYRLTTTTGSMDKWFEMDE